MHLLILHMHHSYIKTIMQTKILLKPALGGVVGTAHFIIGQLNESAIFLSLVSSLLPEDLNFRTCLFSLKRMLCRVVAVKYHHTSL